MIATSYRNARPEDWRLRIRALDPSVRRMIYGPIQSMDEDRPLLWRLFHTGWFARLARLEPKRPFVAPLCATIQLVPSGTPSAPEAPSPHQGEATRKIK